MASTYTVDQGGGGDFLTIQAAVDSPLVSPGDTILISPGTYNESVLVTKALAFKGAPGGPVIVSPLAGSAFAVVGDLGAGSTLSFDNIEFRDAPRSGIEIGGGDVVGTLIVTNSVFETNDRNGVEVVDGSGLSNVVITDSSFSGNGQPSGSSGDGDIILFQYNGDALLKDLTLVGLDRDAGPAENGIQLRSDTGAIGDVRIEDVTIDGIYEKQPIAVFNYDDVDGLKFKNVTITADSTSFNTAVNLDGIGGDFKSPGKKVDVSGAGPDDVVALQGDGGDNRIKGGNENNFLRGHGGDDDLRGKGGDDVLVGSEGDDDLDGGKGNDRAIYAGDRSEFEIGTKTDKSGFVTAFKSVEDTDPVANGDEGSDRLKKIEVLEFGDVTLDLGDPVQLFDTAGALVGTFDNVKDAVTAAGAGYEIVIGEGTVPLADAGDADPAQVVIDKDLTIRGQGQGDSVIQAIADTGTSGDARGMFLVEPGVTLDVSALTVSGEGQLVWQAFRHKGSGTFEDVAFTEIKYNESGPHYAGTAIAVFGGGPGQTVDVIDSGFNEIGRVGVLYFGADVSGTFQGNSYTGKGVGDHLDYALDISAGAVIEVHDNTISDNLGVASSDGSVSAGVLVTTFFGPGTTATIGDNRFDDNSYGVFVGFNQADASTVTLEPGNKFAGGTDGLRVIGNGTVDGVDQIKGNGATVDWDGGAAGNVITGGPRDDDLRGGAGADTIVGGKGGDTIAGGADDDLLTGGKGPDWFEFEPGGGTDTVTDFKDKVDMMDVTAFNFTDSGDFLAINQVGSDVVIDLTASETIILEDIALSKIDDDDFLF